MAPSTTTACLGLTHGWGIKPEKHRFRQLQVHNQVIDDHHRILACFYKQFRRR
jgi:hypothetical protein